LKARTQNLFTKLSGLINQQSRTLLGIKHLAWHYTWAEFTTAQTPHF